MIKRGTLFIALGLALIAAALLLTGYNLWDGHRADVAAQTAVQSLKTIIPTTEPEQTPLAEEPLPSRMPEQPSEDTQPTEQTQPETQPAEQAPPAPMDRERQMPTVELEGYRYIGVLSVDSLELSLPVMEEWDYDRLKISPCRFAGNLYQDNLVICAHNYPQHFASLKEVPLGTEVTFTDAEGSAFRYAVVGFDTVGPDEVEKMVTGDWDLTLFTCNTNGQTRCAVRCRRTS